jgi:hypothetical protein
MPGTSKYVQHLATLGVPPPEDPHDRVQSGRFLRAFLARSLVLAAALWALLALSAGLSMPVLILGGATLALLAADVLGLDYRVRRDERRAAGE